jgi:hypothetical protein
LSIVIVELQVPVPAPTLIVSPTEALAIHEFICAAVLSAEQVHVGLDPVQADQANDGITIKSNESNNIIFLILKPQSDTYAKSIIYNIAVASRTSKVCIVWRTIVGTNCTISSIFIISRITLDSHIDTFI